MRTEEGHRSGGSGELRARGLRHHAKGRAKSRGKSTRHLYQQRVTARRIRKVVFFVLLVGASAGMGYMVSLYQPATEQPE